MGVAWGRETAWLDEQKARAGRARTGRQVQKARLADARARHVAAVARRVAAQEASVLVQQAAEAVQQVVHRRVADLVSECLKAVWPDDPYTFRLTFARKRSRTEAVASFHRSGLEVDPLTEAGGGPVEVAAFALRLAAVLYARPKARPFLLLDEPFRCVAKDRLPRVRALLERLCETLGVQVLMVTHLDELACGTVIDLGERT